MDFDIAGLSDIGRRKEKNEDQFGIFRSHTPGLKLFKEGALLAVADGLGGHTGGEIASKIAVSMVKDLLKEPAPPPPDPNADVLLDAAQMGYLPLLRKAMLGANESIYRTNADLVQNGRPMGTTLLAAMVEPKTAWIGNVGDSRAYHIRDGIILSRTEDHSWVDEQVKQGLMSRFEAEQDKRKNLVTRSIGTQPEIEVDTYRWPLAAGDTLLLCSDGLVNMVRDADILKIMGQPATARELAQRLVDEANNRGGKDNITVIVALVGPNPRKLALLKAKEWLRERHITPARVVTALVYGAACFAAGYVVSRMG
ncbi:MAG: serine/threonine-protein phosphatase [Candidatus Hydrogenedentes bacterium]|nr:serine/threonine-protein phosphatase [Candidatus Hydrogenedentota bacterium]